MVIYADMEDLEEHENSEEGDRSDRDEVGEDDTPYQIYKVTNKINDKIYVGLTKQGLKQRFTGHFSKARRVEKSKRNYFQHALIKYGKENFYIEEIDTCVGYKNAGDLETKWVAELKSNCKEVGYNSTSGGQNFKWTPESIQKIKDGMQRKFDENPGLKEKLIENNRLKLKEYYKTHEAIGKGIPHTLKTRQELSLIFREKSKTTPSPWKGKKHSPETIEKMKANRPKTLTKSAKLTVEQVEEVQRLDSEGYPIDEIKKIFAIGDSMLVKIREGRYFEPRKEYPGRPHKKYQNSEETIKIIKDCKNSAEASRALNISSTLWCWIRKTYPEIKTKSDEIFAKNKVEIVEKEEIVKLTKEELRKLQSENAKERCKKDPSIIEKMQAGYAKRVLEQGHPLLGRPRTEEVKQKISKAHFAYTNEEILNCIVENKCVTTKQCGKHFGVDRRYWCTIVRKYNLQKEAKELIDANISNLIEEKFDLKTVKNIIKNSSSGSEICNEFDIDFDIWKLILNKYDLEKEYDKQVVRNKWSKKKADKLDDLARAQMPESGISG